MWSLGCTIAETLACRPLIKAMDRGEQLAMIVAELKKPVGSLASHPLLKGRGVVGLLA